MSTEMTLDWQSTDIGYLPTTQPGLRTLIVGAGEAGRALARDLKHVDAFGLAPIGFLDDRRDRQVVRRLPVLGTLDDLLSVATMQRVEVVVLAIPGLPWTKVRDMATAASRVGASVRHLPSFVVLSEGAAEDRYLMPGPGHGCSLLRCHHELQSDAPAHPAPARGRGRAGAAVPARYGNVLGPGRAGDGRLGSADLVGVLRR